MKTQRIALFLLVLTTACARDAALPGDSVAEGGAVLLTPPAPTVAPAPVAPPAELGAIESRLFPAELVMERQGELGLTPAQIDTVAKLAREGQASMLDLQWKLQAEKEQLVVLLGAEPIDEAKTLQRAATLMTYETKLKAAHLSMLVRIKNALTAAQRAKLQAVRDGNRCEPADAGVH